MKTNLLRSTASAFAAFVLFLITATSGLKVIAAADLTDAAQKVVAAAR